MQSHVVKSSNQLEDTCSSVVYAIARAFLGPGCLVMGNRYKEVKDGCNPRGM